MSDAVVHADQRLVAPEERERPSGDRDGCEGRAHAGTAREAYTVDLFRGNRGFAEGAEGDADEVGSVMGGCVLGEEAGTRWGVIGVANVGEDGAGTGYGIVGYDAYAKLVGATFAAKGYVTAFFVGHYVRLRLVGYGVMGLQIEEEDGLLFDDRS